MPSSCLKRVLILGHMGGIQICQKLLLVFVLAIVVNEAHEGALGGGLVVGQNLVETDYAHGGVLPALPEAVGGWGRI